MTPAEQAPDNLSVARTAIADDEETTDALLRAADSAHVDIDDVDFPLYDQIDTSALDTLTAHHRSRDLDSDFIVVAEPWERTFVVTLHAVEVY
ncbi:hypothetical protein BRC79_07495, partial [Halobacteriales archaeon QH_8_67_27]